MLQIGDEVVTMSATGRFRVVAVNDDDVTIENDAGVRKVVRQSHVRTVALSPSKDR